MVILYILTINFFILIISILQWREANKKNDSQHHYILLAAIPLIIFSAGYSINQSNNAKEFETKLEKANSNLIAHQEHDRNLVIEQTNVLTGGNGHPFLCISTNAHLDEPSKKYYYIITFYIENKGKYPLQDVSCNIFDAWGSGMMNYGVEYSVGEMGSITTKHPTVKDARKFDPRHKFDIKTLSAPRNILLYMTTFCPEVSNGYKMNYPVEIIWNNGRLMYFINLKITKKDVIEVELIELEFNKKIIEDYKEYFALNPQ